MKMSLLMNQLHFISVWRMKSKSLIGWSLIDWNGVGLFEWGPSLQEFCMLLQNRYSCVSLVFYLFCWFRLAYSCNCFVFWDTCFLKKALRNKWKREFHFYTKDLQYHRFLLWNYILAITMFGLTKLCSQVTGTSFRNVCKPCVSALNLISCRSYAHGAVRRRFLIPYVYRSKSFNIHTESIFLLFLYII